MVGLFLLMPVLSSIMLSQDPPAPETKANFATAVGVTVYVFNSVQVSPGDLGKAEKLAARIFEKAGIKVAWVPGLIAKGLDASPVGEPWNQANLLLRIWNSSTVREGNPEAVGFCLSMKKNEAVVLFDAIQNRAGMLNVAPAVPLGVSIAHEIGHLLLQSTAHSLVGVMKARWLADDLTDAERGHLAFTWQESRSMRNEVLRRTETPWATYERYLHEGARLQKEGRYAEAATAYSAALDEAEQQLGPEHITIAEILVNIGTLRALQRQDAKARAAFERSLEIREKALGADHLQVGFTLLTIAMLTHKQGQYAAAEAMYRRALPILENKLGPEHERTALLKASLGKLYLSQRRNTEAELWLEKAIPVLEKAGESEQSRLVVALNDLAEAYQRDGRYEKAEPLYARVLSAVEQRPAAMNDEIRTGLRGYVQMLRKMKRKPEARHLEVQLKAMLPK